MHGRNPGLRVNREGHCSRPFLNKDPILRYVCVFLWISPIIQHFNHIIFILILKITNFILKISNFIVFFYICLKLFYHIQIRGKEEKTLSREIQNKKRGISGINTYYFGLDTVYYLIFFFSTGKIPIRLVWMSPLLSNPFSFNRMSCVTI